MVIHVALFKWKQDMSKDQVQKIMDDIKNLKGKIPEIVEIYCGENFSKWNKGYTHAVIVTFKNKEDLDIYRVHPLHKQIAKLVDRMEEKSIGIDFSSK